MTPRAAERATTEVLVFEVGGQQYGLPVEDVRELLRAVTSTPLPKAPPIVEGIINARGTVIPLLDIRQRFRLPAKPAEPTDHLIVASAGDRIVALRADRAVGILAVQPGEIVEAARITRGTDYLAGVATLPDGLVLIHDLRTFLSEAEAEALGHSLTELGSGAATG